MSASHQHREPLSPTVRVLVVGDIMLDTYVGGTVARVSPEAPVPVINVTEERMNLGGAGNVATQIVEFGGTVDLLGVIGADDSGAAVLDLCNGASIRTDGIVVDPTRPTSTKQRLAADRHQIARVDRESTEPVDDAIERALLDRLRAIERPAAVIVSDYAKGALTRPLIAAVIAAGRGWDVPVLVDPKGRDFRRYRGATLIKANLAEFEGALEGEPFGEFVSEARLLDRIGEAGAALIKEVELEHLVVTLGELGLVVVDPDATTTLTDATSREVYDVSGAGDTVIATLAMLLATGTPLGEAAAVANAAAGLAVLHHGVGPVGRTALENTLESTPPPRKVVGQTEAALMADRWRSVGKRVVFTNGCFDLLHAGHLHLLRAAAAIGDVLVVALDSDESVRRLKGPTRPVVSETDRTAIIGALACVDVVTLFDSADLEHLISTIRPDVLVKGSDYRADDVVGADAVRSWGGTVAIVDLLPDRSTSAIVELIRGD